MAASRLSFRMIPVLIGSRTTVNPNARPVLIYGASDSGEMLIREILSNPAHNYRPVGFVDEDDRMAGKVIHGYRIFEVSEMPAVIREHGVHEVLIPGLRVSESLLDDLRSMGVSPRRMSIRFE
jgi:FlaA1/EpsC-like NDP-sugar epimerase